MHLSASTMPMVMRSGRGSLGHQRELQLMESLQTHQVACMWLASRMANFLVKQMKEELMHLSASTILRGMRSGHGSLGHQAMILLMMFLLIRQVVCMLLEPQKAHFLVKQMKEKQMHLSASIMPMVMRSGRGSLGHQRELQLMESLQTHQVACMWLASRMANFLVKQMKEELMHLSASTILRGMRSGHGSLGHQAMILLMMFLLIRQVVCMLLEPQKAHFLVKQMKEKQMHLSASIMPMVMRSGRGSLGHQRELQLMESLQTHQVACMWLASRMANFLVKQMKEELMHLSASTILRGMRSGRGSLGHQAMILLMMFLLIRHVVCMLLEPQKAHFLVKQMKEKQMHLSASIMPMVMRSGLGSLGHQKLMLLMMFLLIRHVVCMLLALQVVHFRRMNQLRMHLSASTMPMVMRSGRGSLGHQRELQLMESLQTHQVVCMWLASRMANFLVKQMKELETHLSASIMPMVMRSGLGSLGHQALMMLMESLQTHQVVCMWLAPWIAEILFQQEKKQMPISASIMPMVMRSGRGSLGHQALI